MGFVLRERRAAEPVLPLRLFADPVIRGNVGVNLTSGLLLFCGIYFVPLYMQEVHGLTPTASGLVLVPVMFGAAFGTMLSGRRVERGGRIKPWPIAGARRRDGGHGAAVDADPHARRRCWWRSSSCWSGSGAGFMMQPSLLAVQNAAASADLGTATSTALLFRMLGSTIGVPIFGGLINGRLGDGPRNADHLRRCAHPGLHGRGFRGGAGIGLRRLVRPSGRCGSASASTWMLEGLLVEPVL